MFIRSIVVQAPYLGAECCGIKSDGAKCGKKTSPRWHHSRRAETMGQPMCDSCHVKTLPPRAPRVDTRGPRSHVKKK